MAKYKIMIGGQKYKISLSDVTDYIIAHESAPTEDIIEYWVDEENQEIHASIKSPSQHTLYLISQGRCYLWLDTRMTHKWNRCRGTYTYGPGYRTNWKRGLQRKIHPKWCKKMSDYFVRVDDINNIVLNFPIGDWDYQNIWFLNDVADYKQNPPRTEYYIEFKPILVSVGMTFASHTWTAMANNPSVRSYQTHSKTTKLTIQRE